MATLMKFILFSASVISIQTKTFNKDLNPTSPKDDVLGKVMEVMLGKETPRKPNASSNHSSESKMRIIQVPKRYFERSTFIVEVGCSNESVFAAEVVVSTESQKEAVAFRNVFACAQQSSNTFNVRLKLPRYLAYKPDHFNKYSVYVDSAILRCWLLEKKNYESEKEKETLGYYEYSSLKFESSLNLGEPYERPTRPAVKSYDWLSEQLSKLPYSPKCDSEFEVVRAVTFPVALSGLSAGLHRVYGPYNNVYLKAQHFQARKKPVFSFVMWLYMEEYCKQKYCGILQHITWDDRFATPQISISDQGQVGVELIMEKGIAVFHLSSNDQIIPKHTWSMLIFACQPMQCNLSISLGHPFQLLWMKTISIGDNQTLYFDDTVGMMIYGGSELINSFKGYIGKVTFYRRRAIMPQEAEMLSSEDTAMKLQLNNRHSKCTTYVRHIHQLMDRQKCIVTNALRKVTCPAENGNPLYNANVYPTTLASDTCLNKTYQSQKSPLFSYVRELVREYSYRGWFSEYKMIANEIYSHAQYLLDERGADDMELVISLLKQSSCLGNHDASFMLSVILNYGVAVKSVEVEPHSFLMYGALEGNRLCLLSLGNKHVYALDGFTHDYEHAYVYFKLVAEMTNRDLRVHNMDDVYTEMVRLTNDIEVKEQTQEDGDVIHFLKMRADQGVLLAQKRLAKMYYWGSGGLSRNIKMAFKYYKMAADSGDPSSLYDYAIVLIKGHGTEKNIPLAVELLERSADQGFAQALNSLGWYAMEMEKNNTKAAEYFHRSHDLGNKDASFNLAHMFLRGKYPNSTIDKVRAWEYIAAGALRGQYEAGILVGKYNMRGHPKIRRNPELAVGWMRYVAERNPGIGKLLHKGLRYYKDSMWFSALVYYLMSASTGIEVANFNLAYLCDEDNGGFVKHLEKECKWRHYNLSTQRAAKDVDPYAWNKMAHFHYYHGSNGQQNKQEAVRLYYNAALRGDPQGLYNLAMLVNEDVNVSEYYLNNLLISAELQSDKFYLAGHLLMRCQDLRHSEAYLPCTFALYELVLKQVWTQFGTYIILLLLMIISSVALCSGLRRYR